MAPSKNATYTVAFRKRGDAFADLLYISRDIHSNDGGIMFDKHAMFLDLPVYRIERCCLIPDQQFSWVRFVDWGRPQNEVVGEL